MTTAANLEAGPVDVLAVIRAPLEQYPPSLHQTALLAEAGLRVAVVDAAHPEIKPVSFPASVRRIHAARHFLLFKERLPGRLARLRNAFAFRRAVRQAARELRPKIVLVYDDRGCAVAGGAGRGAYPARIVSHFHELPVYNPGDGPGAWQAGRVCKKFARESDLVIFPDAHRAEIFRERARLARPPVIVMNCPRLLSALPENTLAGHSERAGLAGHRAVFFQGWMGPHRGLETLVRSMTIWPEDSALVLVGPATDAYRKSLLELAAQTGVQKRVLFIDMVPLADLDGLIAGADVAVALFPSKTKDLNFRYLAGASNKRFMYMALGVAQVANTGPGMEDIIERPRCGLLVDPNSTEAVGGAIRTLLENASLRRELGANGRKAHLGEFNYERQFAPVLAQLRDWVAA